MALLGFDSLDDLRASLAAELGSASSGGTLRENISPIISRLLLDQARENERRIAATRLALSLVFLAIAGYTAFITGGMRAAIVTAAAAWTASSAFLYAALRRGWYRNWLRKFVPTADALGIFTGAVLAARAAPQNTNHAAMLGNAALLSVFLIFSGALRLTRMSALYCSGLAIASFLGVALLSGTTSVSTVGIVAGLFAASILARRVTEVIRRVISTEVERVEMERRVDRANARLAEATAASSAREEVLRIVAHDLRNPLNTLLMSADLLTEPGMAEEVRTRQADVIKRTGARMNHMIHDLLDVARMDIGSLSVDAKSVAPDALILTAMELMRPLAAEHCLELRQELAGGLPNVSADAGRITQVFSNLVGNAIKFTPAGGTITIGTTLSEGVVYFTVTDTGPGIPAAQVDKIFGQFWQARKSDNRGIGLGLTIAKGIVEAHGGKIGVSSDVGVGTRFWFSIAAAAE